MEGMGPWMIYGGLTVAWPATPGTSRPLSRFRRGSSHSHASPFRLCIFGLKYIIPTAPHCKIFRGRETSAGDPTTISS